MNGGRALAAAGAARIEVGAAVAGGSAGLLAAACVVALARVMRRPLDQDVEP